MEVHTNIIAKNELLSVHCRRIALAALGACWCLLLLLAPQTASAHGGVIIDGSLTEEYEWLIAVNPYPATPGDTVLTLLIYDLDTYAPINGLDTALYLTPPGSDERAGPFTLLADPEQYPGDYSNIFDIDQEGDWGVTFVVDTGEETLELTSTLTVQPGNPNNPRPTAEGAADVAATATVFAQNVEEARQTGTDAETTDAETTSAITVGSAAPISGTRAVALSDTATQSESNSTSADTEAGAENVDVNPASGNASTPSGNMQSSLAQAFRDNSWLWVLVGALPFALLFLWFLRAPAIDESPAEEEFDTPPKPDR